MTSQVASIHPAPKHAHGRTAATDAAAPNFSLGSAPDEQETPG